MINYICFFFVHVQRHLNDYIKLICDQFKTQLQRGIINISIINIIILFLEQVIYKNFNGCVISEKKLAINVIHVINSYINTVIVVVRYCPY